ncbi:MAG: 4'-phosphopantetheinyl transferase superfamily protein [Gemmatimonadota bacterium]|nr:MAG: 4'-phosphopantetheinyl transferase superfamily protein [Gemmatimonadota bacterium]
MTSSDVRRWRQSVTIPDLTDDAVHVWLIPLDASQPIVDVLRSRLSSDELERAERFVFPRHRSRFIVGRACLRVLLGGYTGESPEDLQFQYGPHGKPELIAESGEGRVRFNLAHSKNTALLAVTLDRAIGIDIEHWRAMHDGRDIATRFFAPAEIEQLNALPAAQWEDGFFACWTRKEAYIKARGEGLAIPLNEFAITTQPDNQIAILQSQIDPSDRERWSVRELHVAPKCPGAVVVEGTGWSLRLLRLPDWPERTADLPQIIQRSL